MPHNDHHPPPRWTLRHPYPASVLRTETLTGATSTRVTCHIELALENGPDFIPGDAIAVRPQNAPEVIECWLEAAGVDGATRVESAAGTIPLREALRTEREITGITRPVLTRYANAASCASLHTDLKQTPPAELTRWMEQHDWLSVLHQYPAPSLSADTWMQVLRPLMPRLYSVASSPRAYPEQVHLLVTRVRIPIEGRTRAGVASSWLCSCSAGDIVPLYVQPNPRFRLPDDGDTPVIMVGPGTGVAPFRAFLQERAQRGDTGGNWLFFGERHRASDFYYEHEFRQWTAQGLLTHLDTAFSRDQPDKIYVQDRIREQGEEIVRWIHNGAMLYLCGDAQRMAPAVLQEFATHMQTARNCTPDTAVQHLQHLQREGRLQQDVY